MTGEPRGFSRVTAGFSSYDGEFRLPLASLVAVQRMDYVGGKKGSRKSDKRLMQSEADGGLSE